MARRKKQIDPRQLTFSFVSIAGHMEKLKADIELEDKPEYIKIGVNTKGYDVYILREGGRMYSRNPKVMSTIDGDKNDPEELFQKNKWDYLTNNELSFYKQKFRANQYPQVSSSFGQESLLSTGETQRSSTQEAQNAGQVDISIGNRKPSSQTRNDKKGKANAEARQISLFDARPVGTQRTRRIEGSGSEERRGFVGQSVRAGSDGNVRIEYAGSSDHAAERNVRLGDFVSARSRYPRTNFRIGLGSLGQGGAITKFNDNIQAIQLLNQLRIENAQEASPEEKNILSRYVGWGGLPQVFDPNNTEWKERGEQLRTLLSDNQYAKARRSTQDAHYTSETVIRGIYAGLLRLGIKNQNNSPTLKILEPSAGIGNFIGFRPSEFNAKYTAIELDETSSQISKYLYPEARHICNGFQKISFSLNFDIVIGNPPFGSQHLFDNECPELSKFSIHNFFITKSIRQLREGGIAAFVVSRFFMDSIDSSAREYIANQADFLGSIRLPQSAFKQNALTDVTTDIVFFKKNTLAPTNKEAWVTTLPYSIYNVKTEQWDNIQINKFFVENPNQIIGKLLKSGGQYKDYINCVVDKDTDLNHEIFQRLNILPENIFQYEYNADDLEVSEGSENKEFINSKYFLDLKDGSFCIEPLTKRLVRKAHDFGLPTYKALNLEKTSEYPRIAAIIEIRDIVRKLLTLEKDIHSDDETLSQLRSKLNTRYENFVKKFGLLNSSKNRLVFRDDPQSTLVQSLEVKYDKGVSISLSKRKGCKPKRPSAQKAAIFTKRVLSPVVEITKVDNVKDALIISLRESGRINLNRISELTSLSPEIVRNDLQKDALIFLNPVSREWEIRDKYLTGNVRQKLHDAIEAEKLDSQFSINVQMLKNVIPQDIEAIDIGVQFGSTWIPRDVMEKFVDEVISKGDSQQDILYMPTLSRWNVKISIYNEVQENNTWGIPEYPASKIIESLLRNTPIKVMKDIGRDEYGNIIRELDKDLTAAATQKATDIKNAFTDWIWQDDDRRIRLTKIYNEKFNTHIPPTYDGSHLYLMNANTDITLRPHQKNAIWRSIQEGTGLFDHVVGAGKTLACIASTMESKRMGFMKKPMIVVPNHLVYQWRDEFYKLYPSANILVTEKQDLTKKNRELFFSKVATGEWDAIIIAHSSFKKIDMPKEVQEEILTEQINNVIIAIEEAKQAEGSRSTIKQLEKQREAMQERYQALIAKGGAKDRSVDFSDLGVDGLFIDESQEFKNLAFATTMNVSGLGNITGSSKALDLFVKCRYLQKKYEGRGVFFLTGTPISNSIAEVFTLQRYLQYDELVNKGIHHFDSWASTFGQIKEGWELDSTGVNYKLKSRFSSFQNVPELLSMYRCYGDVITKSNLDEQAKQANCRSYIPPIKDGKPLNIVAERSPQQAAFMEQIIYRMENLPLDPRIDNPLKVTNDARKAGLDYRLIDPKADDFEGSKVNLAVNRIFEIWKNTENVKGTQLVFCDLSTPKMHSSQNSVEQFTEIENDEDIFETVDDEDVIIAPDMDEILADSSKFSVYDDMKMKLVKMGVPSDQIAFIHDAKTDLGKSKLFSDVQCGTVRILFGSTSKMGAGTNVQERLVAAHHLDAPWRPSDLEQRNGRILRQGNKLYAEDPDNFNVEIIYYATKQTYDARMWQTIEYKAAAIEQFRKGDLLQRTIKDISSEAATAAEMKAAASGNPLILMQVQIHSDLIRLESLYSQYMRTQHKLRDELKRLSLSDARYNEGLELYHTVISCRDNNTTYNLDNGTKKIKQEILIDNKLLSIIENKNPIHQKFKEQILNLPKIKVGEHLTIGKYRGFEINVIMQRHNSNQFQFILKGPNNFYRAPENLKYEFGDKFSISGFFQRVDNYLDITFPKTLNELNDTHEREKKLLNDVKLELEKPFLHQNELEITRHNHDSIILELKRMQDDPNYNTQWTPKTLDDSNIDRQSNSLSNVHRMKL